MDILLYIDKVQTNIQIHKHTNTQVQSIERQPIFLYFMIVKLYANTFIKIHKHINKQRFKYCELGGFVAINSSESDWIVIKEHLINY